MNYNFLKSINIEAYGNDNPLINPLSFQFSEYLMSMNINPKLMREHEFQIYRIFLECLRSKNVKKGEYGEI
jgi:hypothetical protein